MEKSGEQSKIRLRNFAERTDCQLSRNGDMEITGEDAERRLGEVGGGGRNPDRLTSSLAYSYV